MEALRLNRKMLVPDGQGGWRLRVFHRKGRQKSRVVRTSPRYLVKCGCCDECITISYHEEGFEINGVLASKEEWRRLLGPLLSETPRG